MLSGILKHKWGQRRLDLTAFGCASKRSGWDPLHQHLQHFSLRPQLIYVRIKQLQTDNLLYLKNLDEMKFKENYLAGLNLKHDLTGQWTGQSYKSSDKLSKRLIYSAYLEDKTKTNIKVITQSFICWFVVCIHHFMMQRTTTVGILAAFTFNLNLKVIWIENYNIFVLQKKQKTWQQKPTTFWLPYPVCGPDPSG